MTRLPELDEISELRGFRAEAAGREPEDLPRAWSALLAEMRRAGGTAGPRRAARGAGFPAGLARRQIIRDGAAAAPRRPFASRRVVAGLSGAVAAALAGAVAVSLLAAPGHAPAAPHQGLTARYVLDRAAVAARAAKLPAPRPDQFIYVHSVDTELVISQGAAVRTWLDTSDRRIWLSVSGHRASVLRTALTATRQLPWGSTPPRVGGPRTAEWIPLPAPACPPGITPRSSYEFLTTLPTDPATLRQWIYSHKNGSLPSDEQAWTDIGDMFREMLVPPRLAAALFQVAATIPGVRVVPHAVDAAGRPGIAVARLDNNGFKTDELIFDPQTYQLLGERSVLARPMRKEGPAGTVIESTAQLSVAVVNRPPHHRSSFPGRTIPPPC